MSHEDSSSAVPRFRLPLHMVVAVSSTFLISCVVAALSYTAYRGAQQSLTSAADEAIVQAADLLDERIGRIFEPADNQLRLLAHSRFGEATTLAERLELIPVAREVIAGNPIVQAVYAGYPDGEFVLFRPLPDAEIAAKFDAPRGADLMVQSISRPDADAVAGEYRFYDSSGRLLELRALPEYRFDARTRPWYRAGMDSDETVLTEPYLFYTTRVAGVTLTRRTANGGAVIGLDAEFVKLTEQMESLRMTRSSELAIVDSDGVVIAYHDAARMLIPEGDEGFRLARVDELGSPVLVTARALDSSEAQRIGTSGEGRDWQTVRVPLTPVGSLELFALLAIPEDEMFADAREIVRRQVALALLILVLSVPVGWWLTHRTVGSLRRLADETHAIESFDFSPRPQVRSHITEIERLSSATERMRMTISSFLQTNVALGVESEIGSLLDTILVNVIDAARARGGAIYRSAGGGRLDCVRMRGSADLEPGAFASALPSEVSVADDNLIAHAAVERETCTESVADGVRIATPLLTRAGELVGVIVVWLPTRLTFEGGTRDPRLGFVEALSSSAAVAIETRELIEQQRHLLESFIQLIAAAIDAKSPYTGGHCQRVPALAKMLADAAHDSRDGPLANFFLTDDDREALHIGAWLHDCGKITTPEHVVDKATKLECIYDRIHEVRMRFEVLKRDARIAALDARLAGADAKSVQAGLEQSLRALDEEFAFVAECNLGSEAMDAEAVDRLRGIADRTWERTLDDRIGISRDDAVRKAAFAPTPLPVREKLLIDAPWHRIPRPQSERIPADNPWGFAMDVPEWKQDFGELYNLSIRRGTLTPEDRYIINHHMIQTIMMLSKLPFPKHLQSVPEIAGGHHERMDGKGYPRRLKREDMSVLARAMAVADVFEALTAADRPYKAAKTLSQSVTIMANMVGDQHLDPDLFRLFLESGVFIEYAERFLDVSQIDAVDVDAMLTIAGGGR